MAHLFQTHPGDDGLPPNDRRLVMISLIVGTSMIVLDGSIMAVALSTIARSYAVTPADVVPVVVAYQISCAAFIILFAAMGDRYGFRRMYLFGMMLSTVASLACFFSNSLDTLIFFRAVQGIGAAAAVSIGPAIYRRAFPTRLLGSVLGINSLVVASSSAVGPALGGLFVNAMDWHWLFALNVPLGDTCHRRRRQFPTQ